MSMRTSPRWSLRVTALAVLALLVAACGSTAAIDQGVPIAVEEGQANPGVDSGLALQPEGSATAPSGTAPLATGTAGTTSTSGTTTTGSGATSSEAATGTTQRPSEGGQPATGRTGVGVTDDEIVVGIAIADEGSPGNEELYGIEGVTTGDTQRYYEIMRDHINERGGVAGRDIRYSVYKFSTADGAQASQLDQAACTHWTQDDPAYIASFGTSPNFLGCAEDAGLLTYGASLTTSDDRVFREFPHHVEMSSMSLTRQQPNLVAGLHQQGYFDDGYKLGVVLWDEPRFARAFEGSLVASLQARGYEVEDESRIKWAETNADLGQITAQIQSTVLQFKTQGITHVTFIENSAVLALLFMTSAENQQYWPRYGLTSQSGNTTLAGLVPEGQLDGALGIGWVPSFDVPPGERQLTPAAEDCLALYAAEGEEPADANNETVMLMICEELFLIRTAVEAGLPDITNDSFIRGIDTLGDTFPSFSSFGNFFSPQRHDGASHYRHVAYDPGCVCFHYTSDLIADVG